MRRKLWILFIVVLALFLHPCYMSGANPPLQATFIDVGQGDSCWLHLPNGDDVLVDGGGRGAGPTLVAYLQQQGVSDIDLMVATHGHDDHIGGLVDVLASMPVQQAWLDSLTCTTRTCQDLYQALIHKGVVVRTVRMGESHRWGEVTVLVLNPSEPLYASKNENSIVLRVSHGSVDFLLTGDAETGAEGRMLDGGLPLDAEILKVAHHGSNSSSSAGFLSAVAPDDAIISVGTNNQYGHPRAEVLQRLEDVGANIYRTDTHGTVTVTTNGVGWTVNQPTTACVGDANSDGVVDIFDLVIVTSAYNPYRPVSDQRADVNGDSVVNLFDLVLVAANYGCGSQAPAPPATPTPTPTRTRTATVTPTKTPAGEIEVMAWVSNATPSQYSTVTVYGKITRGDVGIVGVPMDTTWHYRTTTSYCSATSGSNGVASCSRRISRATKGYPVRIDVKLTYEGRSYWASTEFTPQ